MRLFTAVSNFGVFSHGFLFFIFFAATISFAGENLSNFLRLARSVEVHESEYGSGPLVSPGSTYYVSPIGNDTADGLTWNTAWRTLKRGVSNLEPGDTLIVGEGEYNEPGLRIECSGQKGSPVTIMAAKGHRVLITGFARPGPLRRTPGTVYTYEVEHKLPGNTPPANAGVWEEPAFIRLEDAGTLKRVEELPGTFYYDAEEGKIFVRFTDSRGPEANRLAVSTKPIHGRRDIYGQPGRGSVELTGSYVHLKGLHFRGGFVALAVFECDNNTIENCSFFATDYGGLVLWRRSNRLLVKNNYGVRNGLRGNIILDKTGRPQNVDSDSLFIGNHLDSAAPTQRTGGVPVYFSIRSYGWPGHRNHIINNIMNEPGGGSLRLRGASPEAVISGNVLTGSFQMINWYGDFAEDGSEMIKVRNNTVIGGASTQNFSMDPSGVTGNWATKDVAFWDNIVLANNLQRIKEARFADPEYLDYRLQSDSPFIGQAEDSLNKGAYLRQEGRVLYVSMEGSDTDAGTSERQAFKTLSKASGELRAGDTLYISEGIYGEPLVVNSSGHSDDYIKVRAHGRKKVVLPGMILNGSYVSVEGLTVRESDGDAITARGDNAILRRCLLKNNRGAGVKVYGAKDIQIYNCTFAGNVVGIELKDGSERAIVRDNIFAGNSEASVMMDIALQESYMSSHNAYHFSEKNVPEREWGSVKGDLKFIDETKEDYSVWKDSPAGHLGIYSEAAGAFSSVARNPEIESIRVTNVRDTSVSVVWETPEADATGSVYYRLKGLARWDSSTTQKNLQGTFHSVSLSGLEPDREYEFKVEAEGFRGGKTESGILAFKTASAPLTPAVFFVKPGGDDNSDGMTYETAWRTIRKANIEVGPGDTILVAPGEYEHMVSPFIGGSAENRITYKRHGEGEVVINGYKVMGPLLFLDSKSHVTIDGFVFTNAVDSIANVVVIMNSSDVEILNCKIGGKESLSDLFTKAVTVNSSPNLRFEGNLVWGTRYHLTASASSGLMVKNNTFVRGAVYSILINSGTDVKFINNIFSAPTSVARNTGIMFRIDVSGVESDYNLFHMPLRGDTVIGGIAEAALYNESLTTWETVIAGTTLDEWRKNSGLDKNSLTGDPLFVDPENGDFRLRPDSPASGRGLNGKNIGAF